MSCCEGTAGGLERYPGTGCCGTSCAAGKTGCSASEPRIRSCFCQENVGCLQRADCGGFRPRGTAATGACPGPCQCAEEEAWNRIVPPKPNCEWLSNFSELRRQWSDHGRQNNCKCCNCKPCRTAAPCKPCLTPPPACLTTNFPRDDCQTCCNERLSGGACDEQAPKTRQQEDRISAGGCRPSGCSRALTASCPPSPSSNMYGCGSPPCSVPSECSIRSPWATCRPPSSCQPCSPSPRAILKKRSCCQCITGICMCQPMPRECNCPPPVQVDARAERECSCDCPSSPECACPPSERRFARTKVKCPNARLCCPTPRPQPGAKCNCTKCQPCLPPPCDPCTSSKCRTAVPKVKPCCGDSPCDESAPCRPNSPQPSPPPCRPTPPCADCRKMAPPCRPPAQQYSSAATSGSRPGSARLMRLLTRPRTPGSQRFNAPSTKYSSPGQSRSRADLRRNDNDEREKLSAADEGFGDDDDDDDDREADPGFRGTQCHCGPPGSRGCDDKCDFCCSLDCDGRTALDVYDSHQCNCDNAAVGCAEEFDYCCPARYDQALKPRGDNQKPEAEIPRSQCTCGADENSCAESCDYCCSRNCDFEPLDLTGKIEESTIYRNNQRFAGGGRNSSSDAEDAHKNCVDRSAVLFPADSLPKCGSTWFNFPLSSTPEVPHLETPSRFSSCCVTNVPQEDDNPRPRALKNEAVDIESSSKVTGVPSITESPSSACRILRCLIRAKSPMKYLQK